MKKRVLSLLLVLAVCLSLLPVAAVSAAQPQTSEPAAEVQTSEQSEPAAEVQSISAQAVQTATQSRKGILPIAGSSLGYNADTQTYDKLYFGTYHEAEGDAGEPYLWRILDGETSTGGSGLFLLSEPYYTLWFTYPTANAEEVKAIKHNQWEDEYCYARKWCDGFADSDWFTADEKAVMRATTKSYKGYHSTDKWFYEIDDGCGVKLITDGGLSNEKAFFLSASEYEDTRYGLVATPGNKQNYVLRSLVSGKHTMDDKSTYDSFVAVAVPDSAMALQRWASYWMMYTGQKMIYEDTWVDRIFGMREYFPFLTEEVYTYEYRKFNARPAMNLAGSKIVYTVAADNSARAAYGVPADYSGSEWKLVLNDGTEEFKNGTSIATADLTFGTDGGTVTIEHPAFGENYDAVTAALLDAQGNILCYGTINSDKTATTSTVAIPSDLPDGVYTLHVTAEKWNEAKTADFAAVPFVAKVSVANEHYHIICHDSKCADGHEVEIWKPITSADELKAMQPDGYYFLVGNITADENVVYQGHLCLNGFALEGTVHTGEGFTLSDCAAAGKRTDVAELVISAGTAFTSYGVQIKSVKVRANATLNVYHGLTDYCYAFVTELNTGAVINIYKGKLAGKEDVYTGSSLTVPDGVTINLYDGSTAELNLQKGATLNIYGGNPVKSYGDEGSTVNIWNGWINGFGTARYPFKGELNLYDGFQYFGDSVITKPINICGTLTRTPTINSYGAGPHRLDLVDANGQVIAGQITNGWTEHMSGKCFNDYFVRDSAGFRNYLGNDGEIYTTTVTHETGSHPICGAECTHNGAHPALAWTEVTTWKELKTLLESSDAQNICLNSDIVISEQVINISSQINLCLHGYKLTLAYGGTGGQFVVNSGAALNITDCASDGIITGGRAGKTDALKYAVGGAIWLKTGATATLYGGTIAESTADLGGAVYVAQGATFTMEGGTLDGNYAKGEGWVGTTKRYSKGGAVYLAGGKFILNGGLLKDNNTVSMEYNNAENYPKDSVQDGGGAVYIADGGSFEMNGGTMQGNYCYRWYSGYCDDYSGHAVRVNSGTFVMNGGTFATNDPIYNLYHTAICVDSKGTFTMNGGSFQNTAKNVVSLPSGAVFNMTGGEIVGGKKSDYEFIGAINMTGGTFNMTGGEITDCFTGVYMEKGSTFTMDNGAITNCSTGVHIWDDSRQSTSTTVFTMNGGKIGKVDGTVTRNFEGYAVEVHQMATFRLKGGEISGYRSTNNTSTGGVDVWEKGILEIYNAPKVYDNYTVYSRYCVVGTTSNYKTLTYPVASNINLHPGAKLSCFSLKTGAQLGLTLRGWKNGDLAGNPYYLDVSNGFTFNSDLRIARNYINCFFADNPAFKLSTSGEYLTLKGVPVEQNNKKTKIKIKVGSAAEREIDWRDSCVTMAPNETAKLTAIISPDKATKTTYQWGLYDPNNTISLNGNTVTARKETGSGVCAYIVLVPDAGDLQAEPIWFRIEVAAKSYTVKFEMNGHGEQIAPTAVDARTKLKIDDPTALGYTFVGWYTDTALTQPWELDTDTVKADMTLYAKWTEGLYTVLLDANGGSCSEFGITVRYLSAYGELPAPTRDDHDFIGWYTAAEGGEKVTEETVLDTVPTAEVPVKIYAHWKARSCTVALDPTGGDSLDPISAPIDGVYGELPTATRAGYTFAGWFTEAEGGKEIKAGDAVDTEIKTLYAHWTANTYTVCFDGNGGTDADDRNVTFGAVYGELPGSSRTGYDFSGWFTAAEGGTEVKAGDTVTTAGNHTLYAHWAAKTYTVTFDPDGGDATDAITVTYDGKYTGLTDATRTGYTFAGWFTAPEGGTKVKTDDTVTTAGDHTLYAHWTAKTYTVTLNANGGDAMDAITVTYDDKYTALTDAARTGYTFVGWFTAKDGGDEVKSTDTVTTAGDHTLYACWTAKTYTLTLDANGGEAMEAITVTYDGKYSALTDAMRAGYDFAGWFTAKEGGTEVKATDTVTTASDHTLYAHWTALPADRPTITVCDDLTLTYGYENGCIYVTVPALENYTLTYQWYRCDQTGPNTELIKAAKANRYDLPLGVAAGTTYYRCDVTATRNDNGQTVTVASDVITVTVNRAKLDAALSMADYTYGEAVSVPALEGNTENGSVTYYYQTAATARTLWQDIMPTTLNAGEYTLIAIIADTANYNGCEVTTKFTVKKATPVVTEWPSPDELYVNDTLRTDWTGAASVDGSFTVTGTLTWNEAGTQTTELTFTPKDTVNYEILTHEASVVVNKRTVQTVTTVLAPVHDKDYGTELAALNLPATVSIVTADGKTFDNVPVEWSGYDASLLTEQTLTGTLDLTAIANEVMQPETPVTATITVTLRELSPDSVEFADKIAVYTGEPIEHTLPAGISGVASVRYEYVGTDYAASETAPTDVGTYTVTATFTMQPGYTQLAPITASLTINKAAGSITAPNAAELTYNGENQALVKAGSTTTGTLEYRLDDGEYGTEIPEATAAGSYTVFYRVIGDKNHEDVAEQSLTVTIAPKPVAVPAADESEFTYNGTEQTYAVATSNDYTVTGNAQANAGTYAVTVALNDKNNTVWANGTDTADLTYTFTIRPAEVTVTAADKLIYVGEAAPDLSAPESGKDYTVTGLIGEYELTTAPTLRYDPSQPDTSAVGDATICIENADAGSNYVVTHVNGKLTITDRPLYAITLAETANGTLAASAASAIEGTTITVLVVPDEGYRLASVEAVDETGNALALEADGSATYSFTMPAGAVTLRAAFEKTVPDGFFLDVFQSDYYYEAVRWAVLEEVTNGMTPDLFLPNGRSTRAQIVTFLWRAAGKPEPASMTSFTDVSADAYYAKAVAWAMEEGITVGTSETTFSPDVYCTRAQCLTLLYRQAKGVAAEGEPDFTDVPADAYYAEAVKWASDNGVTLGTGHGCFSPDRPCTRAESVTFLWRLVSVN